MKPRISISEETLAGYRIRRGKQPLSKYVEATLKEALVLIKEQEVNA